MVDPLVIRPDGAGRLEVNGDAVLRKYGEPVGRDHFRNSVIDLRIDVVGSARQNDPPASSLLHLSKKPSPFGADVLLRPLLLRPGRADRRPGFLFLDVPFLFAQPHQPIRGGFFIRHGDKRANIAHLALRHGLHVVFQVLRVGHHNGTVIMVLGVFGFLMLVKHTGMENGLDPIADQPLHMAVGQLCRVAFRL